MDHATLTRVTAPATEPVTLTEAKAHLRVDTDITDEDALITSLIMAGREWVEEFTWRSLITQTWDMHLPGFPADLRRIAGPETAFERRTAGTIELYRGRVQSVTSITYIDTDGNQQTVDAADYELLASDSRWRIHPAYGKTWPATRCQPHAVTVRTVNGWADAASVPTSLKQAILLLAGHWFANREEVALGTIATKVQMAAEALCRMHRVWRY